MKFLIHHDNFNREYFEIDTFNINYAWEVVKSKFPNAEYIELA